MIDLTPVDVRKKKGDFRRTVRGYEAPAVDEFLDLVAERMEELVKQNVALSDKVGRMEERIREYRERESALTDALVTAQEVREEVRRQAEKAAELVRREAHADAERIRNEALRTREQEEDGLRRVRARSGQFIDSYRRFLEREIAELEVMADSLELRQGGTQPRGERQRDAIGDEPVPNGADVAEGPDAAEIDEDRSAGGAELAGGAEVAGDPAWLSSLRDENA